MTQKHPEVNYVIQPVAGIANWGSGHHSTAAIHFAGQKLFLGNQLHVPVLNPIVPTAFGVFGSTKKMSANFANEVNKALESYPNAGVLFDAHSFGGLLCREFALLSDEAKDRYIGTLTLGTPHLGVETGKWKGFEKTVKNINAFAADIRAGHAETGNHSPVAMIATSLDIMVPPRSALPNIPGAERHLFALPGWSHPELGESVEKHFNAGIEHNGLVAHPHAIYLTTQVARAMLKNAGREVNPLAQTA